MDGGDDSNWDAAEFGAGMILVVVLVIGWGRSPGSRCTSNSVEY